MSHNILIVEDDARIREILKRQLQPKGYDVRSVGSGEEAVQVAQADPPDVIVLDINLPGINGFETLERFQEKPETDQIPVIFLTERSDHSEIIKGYTSGAVYYVPKPFRIEELVRGLEIALG